MRVCPYENYYLRLNLTIECISSACVIIMCPYITLHINVYARSTCFSAIRQKMPMIGGQNKDDTVNNWNTAS